MGTARMNHTATLLTDGRVLIVGGEDVHTRDAIQTVELFDPETRTFSQGSELPAPRSNHQAVRLGNGTVLVMGGGLSSPIGTGSGLGVTDSALIYNPEEDTWTTTGSLKQGRSHFRALVLGSGKVLTVGGVSGNHNNGSECTGVPNCGPFGDTLASAELYDPESAEFESVGSLRQDRTQFTLHGPTPEGIVIAIGGLSDRREGRSSSEAFSTRSFDWSPGPELQAARFNHAGALLPSGRLLVGGGKIPDVRFLASVELLDFESDQSSWADALGTPQTAIEFIEIDGAVFSVGGFNCAESCRSLDRVAIFDEKLGTWQALAPLHAPRAGHSVTHLANQQLLVCGGFSNEGTLASCEITDL